MLTRFMYFSEYVKHGGTRNFARAAPSYHCFSLSYKPYYIIYK